MAGIENEKDVEPLNLYFTDRSSLYEGWDDSDMYDFTESFNNMSLKPWTIRNETNMSQKNDREEIRRKLAMGPVEDDFESEMFKKPGFSSKLQTGMNLQICFMNESQGDKEETTVSLPDVVPVISETKSDVKSTEDNKGIINDGEEDFFKKQARLQQEAKIALAQASTMAHMQVEVEKQKKKQSPVADIIGLPFSNHHRYGKSVYEMNVGQLQTLVNDLHTQIENLNEDLVKLLMERDDLHMMQDSKLVDIEDLTRRAEEKAYRINNKQQKEKL